MNVDPESLLPKLPNPRDLQPFPASHGLIYLGHTDRVTCLSIDPSGQWLATGSDDGTVRLWELFTGRCCKVFFAVLNNYVWESIVKLGTMLCCKAMILWNMF